MAINMSYCRFQNTLRALQECKMNWGSDDGETLSPAELNARQQLIELCTEITDENEEA